MIYGVYCMYDRVAKAYGVPTFFVNDEVCIRSIRVAVQSPTSQMRSIINDIEVVKVGTFDDSTGSITPLVKEELIIKGSSFVEVNDGSKESSK